MDDDRRKLLQSLPLDEKCTRIVEDFDRWLALQVLTYKLAWEDLPKLNDALRGYFVGTRSEKAPPP